MKGYYILSTLKFHTFVCQDKGTVKKHHIKNNFPYRCYKVLIFFILLPYSLSLEQYLIFILKMPQTCVMGGGGEGATYILISWTGKVTFYRTQDFLDESQSFYNFISPPTSPPHPLHSDYFFTCIF